MWPPASMAGPQSPPPVPSPQHEQRGSVWREDVRALLQDELHHLVLEHHGHGHAGFLRLGPQQRGPEHYGHALHRHAVLFTVLDHPAVGGGGGVGWNQDSVLGVAGGSRQGPPPLSRGSPAQVLEEQAQGVVVGGGQRAHQVPHTAAALGLVLQLWGREGSEGEGEGGSATGGELRGLNPSVYVGSRARRCSGRPAALLPICPTPRALTDGRDELAEVREGEKGLRQLSKEELQGTSDNVDVLPAPVVQVEALICGNGGGGGGGRAENGRKRRSAPLCAFRPWGGDWGRASPWSTL